MFLMAALIMAGSCNGGPCVNVYTDPTTNQIVITANQNMPGSAPKPKRIYPPRPYVYRPRPKPVWVPYAVKTVVHKAAPKKKPAPSLTAAVNLSDQITKLLPGNHLLYQPGTDPLSGVPIYFWSDASSIFHMVTSILGIGVQVNLVPAFTWDFGDGSTSVTTSTAGGPYPNQTVTHTYKKSGYYTANLTISWAGTWAAQGSVLPVLGGAIVQNMSEQINVGAGPTSLRN